MGQKHREEQAIVFVQKCSYSEELKHHICKEFMLGGIGIRDLSKKYSITSHSSIHDWLKKYGYRQNSDDIRIKTSTVQIGLENFGIVNQNPAEMSLPEPLSSEESSEEIKRLRKELEDTKLKAEAYLRVIEIAEKELKLPIRKKSSTK